MRWLPVFLILLGILCISAMPVVLAEGNAQPTEPPPASPLPSVEETQMAGMSPIPPQLEPPPTVYPPAQADNGAQVYYKVCMVCHGDQGQGLTDQFRSLLAPRDQNCWQSGCHSNRHPLDGFVFPKIVPAVVGPGVLTRFHTALQLHDFIQSAMPWQAPGSLSADQYWQLTAFLLRAKGYDLQNLILNQENAGDLVLASTSEGKPILIDTRKNSSLLSNSSDLEIGTFVAGIAILAGSIGFWFFRRARQRN